MSSSFGDRLFFRSSDLDAQSLARSAVKPGSVVLLGILIYLVAPADSESGLPLIGHLAVLIALVTATAWWIADRYLLRKHSLLELSSDGIRHYSGTGVLGLPGEYGEVVGELESRQIESIVARPSRSLLAQWARRRLRTRTYVVNLQSPKGAWSISDTDWLPTLDAAGFLRQHVPDDKNPTMHGFPGLVSALKYFGYPVKVLD